MYHDRKSGHLYFAVHLHAFVQRQLLQGAGFTSPVVVGLVGGSVLLWIPIYSTLAFRRVYGGSLVGTLAKEAAIAVIYGIASVVGLLIVVYLV